MKIFILFQTIFWFSFLISCGPDFDSGVAPVGQASVSPPQNPSASPAGSEAQPAENPDTAPQAAKADNPDTPPQAAKVENSDAAPQAAKAENPDTAQQAAKADLSSVPDESAAPPEGSAAPSEDSSVSERVVVSSDAIREKPAPPAPVKGVTQHVCSKEDKKVVYIVYKPGRIETKHSHVCEVDDPATAVLDWAAHNDLAWCDRRISELVAAREAEAYVCVEESAPEAPAASSS